MSQQPNDDYQMVDTLIRIAKDLERVLRGIYLCGALLGFIAFILTMRTMMGR